MKTSESYRHLHGLHVEVTRAGQRLGSGCQVVGGGGGHGPHAHQHRSGDAPDIVAQLVHIWQPKFVPPVCAQHADQLKAGGAGVCVRGRSKECVEMLVRRRPREKNT